MDKTLERKRIMKNCKIGMIVKMAKIIFAIIFLLGSTFACDEAEMKEAAEAYRNCIATSEESIYHQKENNTNKQTIICESLDNFFSGCTEQISALEKCRGISYVKNLKEIRLATVANLLSLKYPGINVEGCQKIRKINREEIKQMPSTISPQSGKNENQRNQNLQNHHRHKSGLSSEKANLANTTIPKWSFYFSITLLSTLHFLLRIF